jgi:carboxylesterase type B
MLTSTSFASPQGFNYDQASAGGHIPGTVWPPPSDEFKCLILQLNIPLAQLRSASNAAKLPVMIYIHGGGFVLGHIDEQHNTALMVGQSVLDNKPVISASIQYRLGPLGYLHVPEAGSANLALNDQRNALRWIQKFIGGFGGDSKRVTVFGESAGSMSICSHMLSSPPAEGPLFNRAILMSGMLGPSTAPTSIEQAQKTYVDFLKRFGIEEQGEAGLSKLRDVELKRLIEVAVKLNDEGGMWLTVKDEQWYGKDAEAVTWDRGPELLAQCDWVDEIVLGTTGFEVTCPTAVSLQFHNLTYPTGYHGHVPSGIDNSKGIP